MTAGQFVLSKCGRDKGQLFVVLMVDGEYLYLVNGTSRPLSKPKKKKCKHVQPTNANAGSMGTDAEIRKNIRAIVDGCGT